MKVIINLTQFTESEIDLVDQKVLLDWLGYNLVKSTTGKHCMASRPHYHTMMVCSFVPKQVYTVTNLFNEKQKVHKTKIYKTLNKTIQDILKKMDVKIEVKVTFKYENGIGKKDVEYDETALQYPFKEYQTFESIKLH